MAGANLFLLGHWSGTILAAWLVYRGAFPDLGEPDWRWWVNGIVYAIGAVFSWYVANETKQEAPILWRGD